MLEIIKHEIYTIESLWFVAAIVIVLPIAWGLLSRWYCTLKRKTAKREWAVVNRIFLGLVVFIIILTTVLLRNPARYDIVIDPLYVIERVQKQPELIRSFLMNILFFVPIGLTFPFAFKRAWKIPSMLTAVFFSAAFSALIEMMQYFWLLGETDIMDIVANTIGGTIGACSYLVYKLVRNNHWNLHFIKRYKKRKHHSSHHHHSEGHEHRSEENKDSK